MADKDTAPTDEQVRRFTFLSPMLDSALSEMREFAKKKQDGIVSATKIKVLNRLLTDTKEVLAQEDSAAYLDLLSEDELPQNSDAVLVLGQYRAALNSFTSRNKKTVDYRETWITKEWIEARERRRQEEDFDENGEDEEDEDEYDDDEYDENDDSDPEERAP
jgi:hypothetical protein